MDLTLNDKLTLIAIFLSPIIPVLITLWYSNRRQKINQKMRLFLTLLAHRKAFPITQPFVDALNTIDVIFYGDTNVIVAWKAVFQALHNMDKNPNEYERRFLDLLDAMAKTLNYNDIRQTDFDAFYQPSQFEGQRSFQEAVNKELLRVLQNSKSFGEPIQ